MTRYELLATRSAELKSTLSAKGKTISYHDVHTAGTCIHNNLILVTLDKHFRNIPGLAVKSFSFET